MSSKSSNSCARTLSIAAARNGAALCDGMQTLTLVGGVICRRSGSAPGLARHRRAAPSLDHRCMNARIRAEHVCDRTQLLKVSALKPHNGLAYLGHLIKVMADKDHGASGV